jgi:quercetin dioxygenase-like cupin family protein
MQSNWKLGIVLGVVFAAGVAVGAWQQQATGTRREPQFENEHVQVWKSIIMPNQPLALHRHDFGRTIVALKGGTLDIVDGNGKTLKTENWETGKAYWLGVDPPGQQHGDMNRGKEPIEVIVVQLKKN